MPGMHPQINTERFERRFQELAAIGAEGSGVHRPALSLAHMQARQWLLQQAAQSGLQTRVDGAANHIIHLPGKYSASPTLLIGSHLDSVPHGGRYDGALGVLAGLEVLHTLAENKHTLPFNIDLIDFTDEEGTHISLLGSRAFTGQLDAAEFEHPHSDRESFQRGLERASITPASILNAAQQHEWMAYLELHIEQGPRLELAQTGIGIVEAIVGLRAYRIQFQGRGDHAGTTPLAVRQDAGLGAAAFSLAAHDLVRSHFPDCVVNVGEMKFAPGAFNVVPERVSLALEFRAPAADTLHHLEHRLLSLAQAAARSNDLQVFTTRISTIEPVPLDADLQQILSRAASKLQLSTLRMPSGALHDAMSFHDSCPSGLIFVPSAGGRSHSAAEFSEWQDCLNGANMLLQTVLELASKE